MSTQQIIRALCHLLNAFEHARKASARTREMLFVAIAKLRAIIAIETAAV